MADFDSEFLAHYLRFGLGSMPKSDVDALVMYLLDTLVTSLDPEPLAKKSNQDVSALLKTPTSKVKRLRYEGALKFGGDPSEEAKGRLLAAVANATFDAEGTDIRLIIEDALAKNWLQGELKKNQLIFDHSFNREIVVVSASGLFDVLDTVYPQVVTQRFRNIYGEVVRARFGDRRISRLKTLSKAFASEAAKAVGGAVLSAYLAQS